MKKEISYYEAVGLAWEKIPPCTKIAFVNIILAKAAFIATVALMLSLSRPMALYGLGLYAILVWSAAFLTVRDWLKHYMSDDPAFERFHISEEGEATN